MIRTAELLRYHDGRMFHTTYSFDHSHAWGGSPLYSIPKALLGIDILEAGYRKIHLDPSLLGLEAASVEIPTPFGKISCIMKKGEKIKLNVPKEITVEYKKIQINKKIRSLPKIGSSEFLLFFGDYFVVIVSLGAL